MTNILVIDDLRIMSFECEYARNVTEAIDKLNWDIRIGGWDEVWWDHDLGGRETTVPVVRLMERVRAVSGQPLFDIRKCVVHTSNDSSGGGRAWLVAGLHAAGYTVEVTNPPVIGHI